MDFSKMSIVGRIGSEFTEHTSANNNRYLKYSIASQPRREGQTNWYNVTVFNEPQINFLTEYVRKGYVIFFIC
ncbi:RIM1-like protein [Saccharomyces kudriavzevii IFO 1802]|uniref:RIM1-like protein n=1 Tax=Saccharomyces kudriavzevii (strain ATCC MYA-4449 / AS 2.2408 / CBS 8840 / NBRC 1802 / NCYC 2889) TaxID=226230 RepID=J5PU81_SACK1|nr:RIM1-like protein [Saccharomyces kudriavzevii IFO 1802]